MRLPAPRGPLTEYLAERLLLPPHELGDELAADADDPLKGEDAPLALYLLYELHYRSFDDVDDGWEWHPSTLALRAALERSLEEALVAAVDAPAAARGDLARQLMTLVAADDGPSLSRHLAGSGTLDEFREFVVHRSAYHLKEADPHTWAIPRLSGGAKAALVEIQADEYGGGREEWMHSSLFARAMRALDLDGRYGAYLERIPGGTLASVNVMSWFGLHRRWRGAIVGNLAVLEMTSSEPMRRYAGALRRLGLGEAATRFYDEHVEADALHEQVAAHDLAGRLAIDEPELVPDILFGAAAVLELEARFAERLLAAWGAGESSLRPSMSHAEVA
jgi:hypothetical protein